MTNDTRQEKEQKNKREANAAKSSDTADPILKNEGGQVWVEQHTQRGSNHTLSSLVTQPLQRQHLDLLHSQPKPLRRWPGSCAAAEREEQQLPGWWLLTAHPHDHAMDR